MIPSRQLQALEGHRQTSFIDFEAAMTVKIFNTDTHA